MEQPSKKSPEQLRKMTNGAKIAYLKLPSTRSDYGLVGWKHSSRQAEGISRELATEVDMTLMNITTPLLCGVCKRKAGFKRKDDEFHTPTISKCSGCGEAKPMLPAQHWVRGK